MSIPTHHHRYLTASLRTPSFGVHVHLLAPDSVHPFNCPTPAFPIGVKPLPLGEGQPTARFVLIGSVRRCSGGKNPPPTFRWPKRRSVGSSRQTQLAYTLASQILRLHCSKEPVGIKYPAPCSSIGWPDASLPFHYPPPCGPFISHNNGAKRSRSKTSYAYTRLSSTYPESRVITHTNVCTVPLWWGRTTSHRCRRLLRNANRPPKRILPCACATNPGTGPFLRP